LRSAPAPWYNHCGIGCFISTTSRE